jgi:hypothetical protein
MDLCVFARRQGIVEDLDVVGPRSGVVIAPGVEDEEMMLLAMA